MFVLNGKVQLRDRKTKEEETKMYKSKVNITSLRDEERKANDRTELYVVNNRQRMKKETHSTNRSVHLRKQTIEEERNVCDKTNIVSLITDKRRKKRKRQNETVHFKYQNPQTG